MRRFGYSDRSFSIEGGQRSGSGRGLFILKTSDGQKLFEDVQLRIRTLKSSSPSDNNSCATAAATLPAEGDEGGSWTGGFKGQPPIPPRVIHPPLYDANGMTSSSPRTNSPKTKRNIGQGQMTRSSSGEEEEEEEEKRTDEGRMTKEGQPRISEVLSRLRSLETTGRHGNDPASADDPDLDPYYVTYSRISLRGSAGGQATPSRPASKTTENPYGEVLVSLRKQERKSLKTEEKNRKTKNKNTSHK